MANLRNIQLLRNTSLYASLEAAKNALTSQAANELDGSPLVGRYTVTVNGVAEERSILGIVHVSGSTKGVTFFMNEKEIDNVLDALDYSGITTSDAAVVTNVTEQDGKINATSANVGSLKLTGYQEASTVADVAATDTLGEALGKLQKTIHEMDKAASAEDGKVVTTVSEANGVVSETKTEVKNLQLGGYSRSSSTGAIASNDTINEALSKLENKTAANVVTAKDKSIVVETTGATTEVGVNIRSGEKVLMLDTDATSGGVYTALDLVKITGSSLPAEIKERYQFKASDGSVIGENIDIPKDSHIVSITYITGSTDPHYQNLEYVYIDASGNTQTTYVDMSELVLEAEFASGVTVTNGVAHGVVDSTSETFLTVGADGFKLSGVQNAINAAVNGLDADVSGNSTHVTVGVVEEDGKITAVTVSESNIANANDLAALSAKTVTGITSTNGSITASIDDAAGNKSYDIITDASKIKMSGFTSTDALSGITSSSSITEAFKEVDNVITTNEEVVSAALNDLNDRVDVLSGKSFTAIESPNNSITFETGATADGTIGVSASTDASKISGLTPVANVSGEISGVTASDSVQTGIKNLYASLAAEIAARKAAISSTTVNGSNAIDVTRDASGDTVSLKLDGTTNGTGSEKTGNDNALTITGDGLFLSTNWDCGSF